MKTLTVGEFKANFSEVLKDISEGKQIAVSYGKKKSIIGYFVPNLPQKKQPKRILGIWKNEMVVKWSDNDKLSEEEFLGLL